MPEKSNIELGSGTLYFNGSDEGIEVTGGELTYTDIEGIDTPEYWENELRNIVWSTKPAEFECEMEYHPKDWTLVKCIDCGCEFPITNYYAVWTGVVGWRCPVCAAKERLKTMIRTNRGGGK